MRWLGVLWVAGCGVPSSADDLCAAVMDDGDAWWGVAATEASTQERPASDVLSATLVSCDDGRTDASGASADASLTVDVVWAKTPMGEPYRFQLDCDLTLYEAWEVDACDALLVEQP